VSDRRQSNFLTALVSILLWAIFQTFLLVCDCGCIIPERATLVGKSPHNSGKQFYHHRSTQQGTGEEKSGKERLKSDRISFEAMLPAFSCSTKPHARLTPAGFEGMVRQISNMLEEVISSKLIMPDDLQAVMYTLGAASPSDRLSDNDAAIKADAQEIVCAAMKSDNETLACKLAKDALEIDPDCVDALVLLANLYTRSLRDAIDTLQLAVAAGERSLGAGFINEYRGYFWLHVETRPYMRALQSLADAFFCADLNMDAVRIYARMLELNPKDNQGARYALIGLHTEIGNLKCATELLEKYQHDGSARLQWARVMERFLQGDVAGARRTLKAARKANRFVELFLTCRHPWPDEMSNIYAPGSEEEAALCFRYLHRILKRQRSAFLWLLAQLAGDESQSTQSADALKRMRVLGSVQ
jgi:tetratricopeptide (TPR) repeat protein